MTSSIPITSQWIKGLRWIAEHEPVGWFDVTGPSNVIVRHALSIDRRRPRGAGAT